MKIKKDSWNYWLICFVCWWLILLPMPFGFSDWQYWSVVIGLCGLYAISRLEEE